MKKVLYNISVAMLLFLVACSGTENSVYSTKAEDEADVGFIASQSSGGSICETADTYYYVDRSQNGTGSMIYFVDKQTGANGALCSKLECTHDSSDCNANAPMCLGLSVYNGRLWWIGVKSYDSNSWEIFSSELDGTGRKAERDIDAFNYKRDIITGIQPQCFIKAICTCPTPLPLWKMAFLVSI